MSQSQMFGNFVFNNIIEQVKQNAIQEADETARRQKEESSSLANQEKEEKYKRLHKDGIDKLNQKGQENEGKVPPPVFTTDI